MKSDTNPLPPIHKFIYFSMIVASAIYLMLLKYAGLYGAVSMLLESTNDVIYNVFLVFSVLIAAFARPVMSRIYHLDMIKKELLLEHGLSESEYKGFVKNQMLLVMASFYELIALFGFLMGILGADWNKVYFLITLAVLLFIINFPRDPAVNGMWK